MVFCLSVFFQEKLYWIRAQRAQKAILSQQRLRMQFHPERSLQKDPFQIGNHPSHFICRNQGFVPATQCRQRPRNRHDRHEQRFFGLGRM